jgi:prepilin-type N-terminal cleavage/methylation domain-containing protein
MKNIYFKKVNKLNRGFTLLEVLVAISIFTVSILGLLVILSKSINDTGYAKKKMIAAYLTQEGIEYIRNMRDTYVLYQEVPGNSWDGFKAKLASCNSSNGCRFDTVFPHDVFVCNNPNDCKLYINNGGYDTNSGGTDSGFIRKIWMTTINADEVIIFSDVSWTQNSGNYHITFSEDLFNWIE